MTTTRSIPVRTQAHMIAYLCLFVSQGSDNKIVTSEVRYLLEVLKAFHPTSDEASLAGRMDEASKWFFSLPTDNDRLKAAFTVARQLKVLMDWDQRQRLFASLEHLAGVDGDTSEEERGVLTALKQDLGLDPSHPE